MGARAELVIEVPAVTVDSILLDHAVQPRFDLLSIDAEGHERKVFKGLSLRCWCPRRVLLEDHETGHQKRQHMLSHGLPMASSNRAQLLVWASHTYQRRRDHAPANAQFAVPLKG